MSVRRKVAAGDQTNPKPPYDPQLSCILLFTGFRGLRFVFARGQVGTPMVSSYGTQPTVAAGAAFPLLRKGNRKSNVKPSNR